MDITTENKILDLRSQGLTIDKIAEIIGYGISHIHRIFKKHGITRKIKITEKISAKILELNDQGLYSPQISAIVGINPATITKFLKKKGVPKIGRSYNGGFSRDIEQKIIDLTVQGYGRLKIATVLGLEEHIVRRFTNKIGIKSGNVSDTTKITLDMAKQIFELINQGFNYSDIAKFLGSNKYAIRQFCIRNNIKPKEPTEEELKEIKELKRLRKVFSKAIHRELRALLVDEKHVSFTQHLPYTIQELKAHLEALFEPWMTWNNWGVYNKSTWNDNDQTTWVWHIDHIIPCSEFVYKSMKDQKFKDCWALSNLRPLGAKQNISDGAKRVRHQVIKPAA